MKSPTNPIFVNKDCTDLKDFVVDDTFSDSDLEKLAELNGIELQIQSGWYTILIELIKELSEAGWNHKVTCIKEKYGRLTVYTEEITSEQSQIINKYCEKSNEICEFCGDKGRDRGHDWITIECPRHYWSGRGSIKLDKLGFTVSNESFKWVEFKDAQFEDYYYEKNCIIKLFFKDKRKTEIYFDDELISLRDSIIGYRAFLNKIPKGFKSLDYEYIKKNYSKVSTCEICGFEALYGNHCECCENEKWISEEKSHFTKDVYIKLNQMRWKEDDGEKYAVKFYRKGIHKILFTSKEYENYLNNSF
ncbi:MULTISPECIES: hypothetical protein [Flavobacteriaceae]|uniref:hypothetical protein n=1 Tax=Flavobacteriaceae TaxID=49546 RepID=UPI0014913479|nr:MULTISPECIES: hypothetical protein [Allomuricauda]MDC6364825.1 hypothetical protein [Muricauda sp. AC10]